MKPLHVSIRQIGNSHGVVIPKPLLAQVGLESANGAEMTIESGAIVLRRPAATVRVGWADAAKALAANGGVVLAESEDTAAIYGMPGSAVRAGVVDQSVPIQLMGDAIIRAVMQAIS